jgi:Arc/MetJ family transcription regulator
MTLATIAALPEQATAYCFLAYETCILMHMRTTLILDEDLLTKARRLTGIQEKTALVHAGLKALIAHESARRLSALGGTEPQVQPVPRRRPRTTR